MYNLLCPPKSVLHLVSSMSKIAKFDFFLDLIFIYSPIFKHTKVFIVYQRLLEVSNNVIEYHTNQCSLKLGLNN